MLAHAFLAVATAIERDHTPTTPYAPARPDRLKLDRLAASRADIVAISARIKELDAQIPALLKALGCTLTAIHGIGVVTAMTLLTKIGDPHPVQHGSTVLPLVRRRPGRDVLRRGRRTTSEPPPRPPVVCGLAERLVWTCALPPGGSCVPGLRGGSGPG